MGKSSKISERIIEDIFVLDKRLLANILNVNLEDLVLIARQKVLNSGLLDLLYVYQKQLFLIELKVVTFKDDFIKQINTYEKDLLDLQESNKLIDGEIKKYIFVTKFSKKNKVKCDGNNIHLKKINPAELFHKYHQHFKELSQFLKIKSADYGVVRIGLLNSTIFNIGEGYSINKISKIENRSPKTIRNRISVAIQLGLVIRNNNKFFLTELGNSFIKANENKIGDSLTNGQIDILYSYLKDNPLQSSIAYTIFTLVESVFVLSKSIYPVPFEDLKKYFVKTVGKENTWKSKKSKKTATYIFSNYAIELELISKMGNNFFITPKGIQSVLLLQLNRSIKLIETKSIIG